MSILSSIYGEMVEKIREELASELRAAYEARDWGLVEQVIQKIENYHFGE